MDYHIETAEVLDAFKEDSECPFCLIREKLDASFTDTYLGGAAMSPDYRVEVNKKGFCARHFKLLYDGGKRLPLALQLHTFLLEHNKKTAKQLEALAKSTQKDKKLSAQINEFINFQAAGEPSCVICEKQADLMQRYMDTALALWSKSIEFKEIFRKGRGLCEPHFSQMLARAQACLNSRERSAFIQELAQIQIRSLERLAGEVEWFTKKFDYQNKDKPWGTSQDSIPRSINKLKGKII